MASKPRKFRRSIGDRRIKVLFLLSVEGYVTEQQYFNMFNNHSSVIQVECISKKYRSSPQDVLKAIKQGLANKELRKEDEAWLIVDKDQWSDDQLDMLFEWSKEKHNYHFALSNPCFEYWLLLHFEKPKKNMTTKVCCARLKSYWPDYNKGIPPNKITELQIQQAVGRAASQDQPQSKSWPNRTGSTVYRLIENINKAKETHC